MTSSVGPTPSPTAEVVAANTPDELPALGFADADAFGRWLEAHHATSPGLWLQIPKKGRGVAGPTYGEALDEALRFGWIDSQKIKLDADAYLQRFTPRTARSRWSKVNRNKIEALTAAGRMAPAGVAEVERAKADGRWDAAYDPPSTATAPPDLQQALDENPAAGAFFASLSSSNRFSIVYRINDAKRPETRARRIARYVEMCARGETIH